MNKKVYILAGVIAAVGTLAAIAGSYFPAMETAAVHADMRTSYSDFFHSNDDGDIRHLAIQYSAYDEGKLDSTSYQTIWSAANHDHMVFHDSDEGIFAFMNDRSGEHIRNCFQFPDEQYAEIQEELAEIPDAPETDVPENGGCRDEEPNYYVNHGNMDLAIENMRIEREEDDPESVFVRFESEERFYNDSRLAYLVGIQEGADGFIHSGETSSEDAPDHLRFFNKQEDGKHKHSFDLPIHEFDVNKPVYIQVEAFVIDEHTYTDLYELDLTTDSIEKLSTDEIDALQKKYVRPDYDMSFIEEVLQEDLLLLSRLDQEPLSQTWETWGMMNDVEVLEYDASTITYEDGEQMFIENDGVDTIHIYKLGTEGTVYGFGYLEDGVVVERVLVDVAEVITGYDVEDFFSEKKWKERNEAEFSIKRIAS